MKPRISILITLPLVLAVVNSFPMLTYCQENFRQLEGQLRKPVITEGISVTVDTADPTLFPSVVFRGIPLVLQLKFKAYSQGASLAFFLPVDPESHIAQWPQSEPRVTRLKLGERNLGIKAVEHSKAQERKVLSLERDGFLFINLSGSEVMNFAFDIPKEAANDKKRFIVTFDFKDNRLSKKETITLTLNIDETTR